ncbi:MAG: alpha/beta hydrolase [Acidobacteriota bacterium]
MAEIITSQYINTNNIRLHCMIAGEGEPIILLHGFPEHWYSWRHQIPALINNGQVIVPDLRGYNLSDKPVGVQNYDIDILAKDVIGIIEAVGAHQAIVIGHDWGGAIAWWLAIRHPQMVKRLVVMNCPHPIAFQQRIWEFEQFCKSWYMFFFQLPWLPEQFIHLVGVHNITARIFRDSAVEPTAFSNEDIDRLATAIDQPGALTAMINYYRAGFRRCFDRALFKQLASSQIEMPTLIIWGEQDRFLVRGNTEGLQRWVKDLTVKYLPDSGHWVQQEKPEIVNELLKEFLLA